MFLHTELLDQHILVEPVLADPDAKSAGKHDPEEPGWRVSALIDFADARVGAPGYDLPALAEFLFRGEPGVWQPFFEGYGWKERFGSLPKPEQCLSFGLQHQFASLERALEAAGLPGPEHLADGEQLRRLARRLYPLGG